MWLWALTQDPKPGPPLSSGLLTQIQQSGPPRMLECKPPSPLVPTPAPMQDPGIKVRPRGTSWAESSTTDRIPLLGETSVASGFAVGETGVRSPSPGLPPALPCRGAPQTLTEHLEPRGGLGGARRACPHHAHVVLLITHLRLRQHQAAARVQLVRGAAAPGVEHPTLQLGALQLGRGQAVADPRAVCLWAGRASAPGCLACPPLSLCAPPLTTTSLIVPSLWSVWQGFPLLKGPSFSTLLCSRLSSVPSPLLTHPIPWSLISWLCLSLNVLSPKGASSFQSLLCSDTPGTLESPSPWLGLNSPTCTRERQWDAALWSFGALMRD